MLSDRPLSLEMLSFLFLRLVVVFCGGGICSLFKFVESRSGSVRLVWSLAVRISDRPRFCPVMVFGVSSRVFIFRSCGLLLNVALERFWSVVCSSVNGRMFDVRELCVVVFGHFEAMCPAVLHIKHSILSVDRKTRLSLPS